MSEESNRLQLAPIVRGWCALWRLSLVRMFWSSNTVMVLLPLCLAALVPLRRRFWPDGDDEQAFLRFSGYVARLYVSFVVPICSLAFATSGIGGDREDQSLAFLIVRPLPRWSMLLAKYAAALPLAAIATMGGLALACGLAGPIGREALSLYWPACLLLTAAYVGLFQLVAAIVRHGTIVSLAYTFFIEALVGNMPGMAQRLAVGSYARAWIDRAAEKAGHSPTRQAGQDPVAADTAVLVLALVALLAPTIAAWAFSRREPRDGGA